jgi:hypothetical protein
MPATRKADHIVAFTIFGVGGITPILIPALIVAAPVFVVRRA